MEKPPAEMSPKTLARIGGALYLAIIVIGAFGEIFVHQRIVVAGNAALTAAHIQSMESLWRFSIAAELVLLICAVALLAIFYILLKPVSRRLALLAVLFNLVAIAVEATITMRFVEALFPLGNSSYLAAFSPAQRQALVGLSLESHAYGYGVSLVFFGCFCITIGYLIFRSGYFPKVLGVLMQIAGLCYLVNSFALILSPALSDRLFPAILAPSFIGELSLCLWLLVMGVNMDKLKEKQAVAAAL